MTIQEILKAATPRPWPTGCIDLNMRDIPWATKLYNDQLAILAVNAYERDQQTIQKLTEALEECMKDTFTAADGMSQSGKQSYAGTRYRLAEAALALAKEGHNA